MERLTEKAPRPSVNSQYVKRKGFYTADCIERLGIYEDTGLTPEQIRELKELDLAKMPMYEGDEYADGKMVYDIWICPNCGTKYEVDYDDYDFCPNCGQRIRRQEN